MNNTKEIKVMALDPSSTRTGYCFMRIDESIIEAGVLTPDKRNAPPAYRIETMCRDLAGLLERIEPDVIVIEWTGGKVGRRRHKGGGAGLAVYGIAVGALWRTVVVKSPTKTVELIEANEWTRGVPKEKRITFIRRLFKEYDPSKDPGGDVADAIGLVAYYINKRKLRLLAVNTAPKIG